MRHLLPLLLLLCAMPLTAAERPRYVPGEILIKYRAGADIARLQAATRATRIETLPGPRWQRLKLPAPLTVEQAVAHYRAQPDVEYAEPNYRVRAAETTPDDTEFNQQWALQNMRLPLAWDLSQGDAERVIAIVDTGIFYTHPDLAGNMWVNAGEVADDGADNDGNGIIDDVHGVNYNGLLFDGDPVDDNVGLWHGTHVAGIAGAVGNNGRGIAGVNWRVRLMAVKVLHGDDGEGLLSDVIKGIDYAIANGAHIINLSLEIPPDALTNAPSAALTDALTRADAAGVLTVSAAGNTSIDLDAAPWSPAAIRTPNNITVAALTRTDGLAEYSNYGRRSVDLAAPGGEALVPATTILSTVGALSEPWDNYYYHVGTSMAAPHVAGLAALVWAHAPTLTHHQVKARILNGVRRLDALDDKTISGGTADAYAALAGADAPAVFDVAPAGACLGEALVIRGTNFGAGSGEVYVDGLAQPLVPTAWSAATAGVADEVRIAMPGALPVGEYRRLWINGAGNGSGFFVQRSNCLPGVGISVTPDSGSAPLGVTLTATAEDTDGSIVRYEWDLGDGVFSLDSGASASVQHTFSAGGSYTVRVRVTDDGGAMATAATVLNVTSSGGGDSRCFIATAAYGSPLQAEVMALRRLRDRYLLGNAVGERVVALYYALSPPLADAIRQRDWLRGSTRELLRPLVSLAGWLMKDAAAGSAPPQSRQAEAADAVAGEYLVGFAAGTTEQEASRLVSAAGGVLREYNAAAAHGLAQFPVGMTAAEVSAQLLRHAAVRYVEPNRRVRIPAPPQ